MTIDDFTDDVIDAMAEAVWLADMREHGHERLVTEASWARSYEMYVRRARVAADAYIRHHAKAST